MSATHSYEAATRTATGTTAATKQRAAGQTPVTISKRGAPSRHAVLPTEQAKHLAKHVTHLCKIKLDGKELTALKGEVAVHCLEDYIQHIDLQEVDAKSEIVVDVAVNLKAEDCPGVKSGGIVEQRLRSVKVRCPANAIPDALLVDLSNVQIQETVYAKSLTLPKGTALVTRGDLPVLSIVIPRWMKKADETAAAGTEGAAAAATPAAGDAKAATPAAGAKPDAKAADAKAPAKK